MGFDNSITVIGNLVRDPDLRYSATGSPVVNLIVAWNDKKKGNESGDVSFFDIICFGSLAENVSNSLYKGDRVVVFGTLTQRKRTDSSGNDRHDTKVRASDVSASLKWAEVEIHRNTPRE